MVSEKEISEHFEWLGKFKTVRIFHEYGEIKAKKIAIIDGKEVEEGTVYDVIPEDINLPEPGDYSVKYFKDMVIAADIIPEGHAMKPKVSRDTLIYDGKDRTEKM